MIRFRVCIQMVFYFQLTHHDIIDTSVFDAISSLYFIVSVISFFHLLHFFHLSANPIFFKCFRPFHFFHFYHRVLTKRKNGNNWNKAFLLHLYFILFIFRVVRPLNALSKHETKWNRARSWKHEINHTQCFSCGYIKYFWAV